MSPARGVVLACLAVLGACSGRNSAESSYVDDVAAPLSSTEDIVIPDIDIPASSPSTTLTTPTPTAPTDGTIALMADGQQNTDPFTLDEGAYAVTFDLRGACLYAADLIAFSSEAAFLLPTTITIGAGPVAGTTNLYDVTAGDYYVSMRTGPTPTCPWSIVLSRRSAPT